MLKRILVVLPFVILGLGGSATPSTVMAGQDVIDPSSPHTGIWVSGHGKVSAQPKLALLFLGVEVHDQTVEEARSRAAASMKMIVDTLKQHKIADANIQTRYFNVSPQYSYQQLGGAPRFMGYTVTNQASVKVHNLDDLGAIIDNVTKAGGDLTRLQGITFTIEDPSTLQNQARELAIKEATTKAALVAKAAGVDLGRVFYIAETVGFERPPMFFRGGFPPAPGPSPPGPPTPISPPSELDVDVTVQVAFSIR